MFGNITELADHYAIPHVVCGKIFNMGIFESSPYDRKSKRSIPLFQTRLVVVMG